LPSSSTIFIELEPTSRPATLFFLPNSIFSFTPQRARFFSPQSIALFVFAESSTVTNDLRFSALAEICAAFFRLGRQGKIFSIGQNQLQSRIPFRFCFWQHSWFETFEQLPFRIFSSFGGDGNDAFVRVDSY
jgi:hypothetical protein